MKIYKIAQIKNDLYLDVENLPDRRRIYLRRRDGQKNAYGEDFVGKLTIQLNYFSANKDMLTAFKIDPEYRGQGWGRKMIEEAFKYQKNPLYVNPEPYGSIEYGIDYDEIINGLKKMYGKFGFEPYQDNFMVRNVK